MSSKIVVAVVIVSFVRIFVFSKVLVIPESDMIGDWFMSDVVCLN